ncbi:MAG: hypothetical protein OER88_02190 [Planctomycetota bacterium]|nr:hypothetical protein [Planctomycetota bacterium]
MKARLVLALFVLASIGLTQDPKPPTLQVFSAKTGTVRRTMDSTGTLVPANAAAIRLDLKVYDARSGLRLIEVLDHGTFVNEGDVIARIDPTAIDRMLKRDRMSLDRTELDMRHAEEKERMQAEQEAEQLQKAETDAARAEKKLKGYREHEMKFTEESERLSKQARRNRVDDQKDELEQLEKMYGEDELVDATEEIVIKRSRRNFARSTASQDLGERRRKYTKEWYYHWSEEDLVRNAKVRGASLARLRRSQEMSRERRSMEMEHKRFGLARQRERFADLQKDREQFVVRAPRGGILLHGEADAVPAAMTWKRGATVRNRAIILSVAGQRAYKAVTKIAEKDVLSIPAGAAVEVAALLAPKRKMMGRLQVEYLPKKGGMFDATVTLAKQELRLRPGLSAKVIIVLEEERDAVTVPSGCVIDKGGKKWVMAGAAKDGPFVKREVTVGVSNGKRTAIRSGLKNGEFVQQQRQPARPASPAPARMRKK